MSEDLKRRYVMKVVLERYHGLSNDYVVFDPNKNELELTPGNVKMICDRNAGLGADGVLEGPVIKEDGMHVKVWNPDGSESVNVPEGFRWTPWKPRSGLRSAFSIGLTGALTPLNTPALSRCAVLLFPADPHS